MLSPERRAARYGRDAAPGSRGRSARFCSADGSLSVPPMPTSTDPSPRRVADELHGPRVTPAAAPTGVLVLCVLPDRLTGGLLEPPANVPPVEEQLVPRPHFPPPPAPPP